MRHLSEYEVKILQFANDIGHVSSVSFRRQSLNTLAKMELLEHQGKGVFLLTWGGDLMLNQHIGPRRVDTLGGDA